MNGMEMSREIKALAKKRQAEYGLMQKKYERFAKKMFLEMCGRLGIPAKLADVKIRWPFVDPVRDKLAGKIKKKGFTTKARRSTKVKIVN